MDTVYPKGAIKSLEELQSLDCMTIYFASRAYSQGKPDSINYNGTIQHHYRKGKLKYVGMMYDTDYGIQTRSTLDANIPANSYNDWFAFIKLKDAEEYLK